MKTPNEPENQIQEVLYYLIKRISIDRRQMILSAGVLNLPDNIMKLRREHGLTIDLKMIEVTNKFERKVSYGQYTLLNKKEAAAIYKKMQDKQKTLKL